MCLLELYSAKYVKLYKYAIGYAIYSSRYRISFMEHHSCYLFDHAIYCSHYLRAEVIKLSLNCLDLL